MGEEGQHHRNLVAGLVERVSRAHRHRHQRAQRVPAGLLATAEQNATIAIGDGCERNIIEGHVERAAYLFHIVEGDPRRAVASQIGDGAGQRRRCGRTQEVGGKLNCPFGCTCRDVGDGGGSLPHAADPIPRIEAGIWQLTPARSNLADRANLACVAVSVAIVAQAGEHVRRRDSVGDAVAVQIVEHHHVKRCRGGPTPLETPHVQRLVVGAPVGQPVNEPW